jgi:thiamine pyrophosphokinase
MSACFIIGAGPFFGLPVPPAPGDFIIAADGGYRHCQAAGLVPDLLLGDFDSLGALPPAAEVKRFPVDKDDTDTMLAFKLGLDRGYRTFRLYGGTGGRMDHTLANLQGLAYLARRGAKGYLYDETFVFTALWNDSLDLPARPSGVFSVFALGADARGVSITGGRYPLEDGDLSPYFPLGVSNHFGGRPVRISVREGCLLVGWELP